MLQVDQKTSGMYDSMVYCSTVYSVTAASLQPYILHTSHVCSVGVEREKVGFHYHWQPYFKMAAPNLAFINIAIYNFIFISYEHCKLQ